MIKPLATWGLEPASPVSVNRHVICSRIHDHHTSLKNSISHDVIINIGTNGKRQCSLALGMMHPFLGMHDGREHIMSID